MDAICLFIPILYADSVQTNILGISLFFIESMIICVYFCIYYESNLGININSTFLLIALL